MLLHGEKERLGHSVRVYRPTTHQKRYGRIKGQVSGHILSEAEAQQPSQVAWICLPRTRHQASDNT